METAEIHPVVRINGNRRETIQDTIVKEQILTILLNGQELVTIICTPHNLQYLAVGFLYSERFIQDKKDIISMTPDVEKGIISVTTKNKEDPVEDLRHTRFLVPGCFDSGVFSKASDAILSQKIESEVRLEAERIVKIVQQVQSASILYRSTGGVHGAALCTPEELLFFSEDIGRHNAIDKVVGRCLLSDIPTEDKIIVTSGRISSAVLLKIVKSAIPVLISRSAPTTEAVRFADKFGITLIGFVRGKRFNIYSHDWRVLT